MFKHKKEINWMATINLTDKLHMFWDTKHNPNDLLLKAGHVDSSVIIDIPNNNEPLNPGWIDLVDTVRADTERIKDNSKSFFFLFFCMTLVIQQLFEVKRLGDLHQCRLKVSFDDRNMTLIY